MTKKIDLVFKVECRRCGTQTVFDLTQSAPEDHHRCSGCGHLFALSHDLAGAIRQRIDSFINSIPEEPE